MLSVYIRPVYASFEFEDGVIPRAYLFSDTEEPASFSWDRFSKTVPEEEVSIYYLLILLFITNIKTLTRHIYHNRNFFCPVGIVKVNRNSDVWNKTHET